MKLSIFFTAILSLASSVVGKGGKGRSKGRCVFDEITEFGTFFEPGTDMNRFGRASVCSGFPDECDESSDNYLGFYQGYCVNSAGPEDTPSELCRVSMILEGDYLVFEYHYPTYLDVSEWGALIVAGSGCYAGFQGSIVPVSSDFTGEVGRFTFFLDVLD